MDISSSLTLSAPTSYFDGFLYQYNTSVATAPSGLVLNDLSFAVTYASNGTTVNLGTSAYVEVFASAGSTTPLAEFTFYGGLGWSGLGTPSLAVGQVFELYATQSLSGDKLTISGVGHATGSVSVTIS